MNDSVEPSSPTATAPALRVSGGRVIDPANGVDAVRDVLVRGGRVVEALSEGASEARGCETIDASGRLVLPGAIDMHTHIASRGVAIAHEMSPELVPSPSDTARGYLGMGYSGVIDAAVPPEDVAWAHKTLDQMPWMDTGFLLELGSHDELIAALTTHGEAAAGEVIRRLIAESGALGLKLVSLRHSEGLDAPINGTRVTPRRLIRFAAEAAAELPVAHPLQLHVPDLGSPDNITNTLTALDALEGRPAHLAHAQFYAYRTDEAGRVCSAAAALCAYLARHEHITVDSGCIAFGPAQMVTRDHLLAEHLAGLMRGDLVVREGWSVMPMRYEPMHAINAVQWATGLELILRSADLSRVALSVDHPNGGSFTAMPGLLELLANRAAREAALEQVHAAARERTGLGALRRELSDAELVMLTRVAPARGLGLDDRGHLGSGAVADLVITERVWARPAVVVKSGRVVARDGEVGAGEAGRRLRAG